MNVVLLSVCLFCFITQTAAAETPSEQMERLSGQIMSPYCPGRTLAACPSEEARMLRAEIGEWFSQGYSETAVLNQLQMLHGQDILGVPEKRGFGLVGWYAPSLFVMFGILLSVAYVRLRRPKINGMSSVAVPMSAQRREQIEGELQRRLQEE